MNIKLCLMASAMLIAIPTVSYAVPGNNGEGEGGCGVGQTTNGCTIATGGEGGSASATGGSATATATNGAITNTNTNTANGGAGGNGGSATATVGPITGSNTLDSNINSTNTVDVASSNSNSNSNSNNNAASSNQSQSTNNSNNSSVVVQGDKEPASTSTAPSLVAGTDTCMGSTSMGGQGMAFGFSFGSTWTDKNCVRLKNSRQLQAMGYTEAAAQLMCQDKGVREAMELAGTPCIAINRRKND